ISNFSFLFLITSHYSFILFLLLLFSINTLLFHFLLASFSLIIVIYLSFFIYCYCSNTP
ncbi:hypothetical protein C1646_691978, partial [Rhizophagus diaphanus]